MMRLAFTLLLATLFPSIALACPEFTIGIKAYENSQYQAATSAWETCVQKGLRNADLHYNIGNAEYRLGNLGRAIWNYEIALRLDPGNSDITKNLQFAKGQTIDKIAPTSSEENPVFAMLSKVHHALSLNQELWILVAFAWLALLAIVALHSFKSTTLQTTLKGALFALSILTGVLVLHIGFKAHSFESSKSAVILVRSADVMSGPGAQYQVLHELHEGTRVEVLEIQENWVSVQLGDAIKGFMSVSELGLVH